jgi:hypothetical protein
MVNQLQSQPMQSQAPPRTIIMEKPRESSLQESKQELKDAIKDSQKVLVSATTVFPFTLFPDTITVDRTKLTVAHRSFFSVADVVSIRIEDILNVTASVGPFFGSIRITSRFFNNEMPYVLNHFWRDDAMRVKRITQGYIIALEKKIDCSSLPTQELAAMLDKLGEDDH